VSTGGGASEVGRACAECLRRSWLLAELGAVLDCNCRADGRLLDLLLLDDSELIAALGGRRRAELTAAHAAFRSDRAVRSDAGGEVCRHDDRYPPRLRTTGTASMLHLAGGARPVERLRELTTRPVVAFVGHGASSDYGAAIAASLARSLAASGVTVAGELTGAIGPAALGGALEVEAGAIAAIAGGLAVGVPSRRRSMCRRLTRSGCAISELPCTAPRRRWCTIGCERVLASLASVALVVEADDSASGLSGAQIAATLGRVVAAVPGRVTSRGSYGAHALLRDGACLITCAADVLELICDADGHQSIALAQAPPHAGLEPRLLRVLERVGAGCDTPGRLLAESDDAGELFRSLGELELSGLLTRGDGGRYLASDPLATGALRYGMRDQMEP
jgi:DNA processing protein